MKLISCCIQNFEGHKETNINFSSGVNTIIGPTGKGKSSILRAIEWCLFNRPSGDEYRSDFGGDTSVRLIFEKGWIERKRTNSFNGYILNGQEFKAFNKTIPEEIESFINMNDVNFESQFDSHFMISWKSAQIGQYLNKITDLEASDRVILNLNKKLNSTKKTINRKKENVKENIQRKKELNKNIDTIATLITRAEEKEKQITVLSSEMSDINDFILDLKSIKSSIDNYKKTTALKKKVVKLEKISDNYFYAKQQETELNDIIIQYNKTHKSHTEWSDFLQETKKELEEITPENCPLCGGSYETR